MSTSTQYMPANLAGRIVSQERGSLPSGKRIFISVDGLTDEAKAVLAQDMEKAFPHSLDRVAEKTGGNWFVTGYSADRVGKTLHQTERLHTPVARLAEGANMQAMQQELRGIIHSAAKQRFGSQQYEQMNLFTSELEHHLKGLCKDFTLADVERSIETYSSGSAVAHFETHLANEAPIAFSAVPVATAATEATAATANAAKRSNRLWNRAKNFVSSLQSRADQALVDARGTNYIQSSLTLVDDAERSTGPSAGAWFKRRVLGWENPGAEALMRTLSTTERAEPGMFSKIWEGAAEGLERGSAMAKGASRFGSNVVLAGAAGVGLLTLGAVLSAPKRFVPKATKFDDGEALAFSGGNTSVDLGGIAMPGLGQEQTSSWISRVPSLEDQMAMMQQNLPLER